MVGLIAARGPLLQVEVKALEVKALEVEALEVEALEVKALEVEVKVKGLLAAP